MPLTADDLADFLLRHAFEPNSPEFRYLACEKYAAEIGTLATRGLKPLAVVSVYRLLGRWIFSGH